MAKQQLPLLLAVQLITSLGALDVEHYRVGLFLQAENEAIFDAVQRERAAAAAALSAADEKARRVEKDVQKLNTHEQEMLAREQQFEQHVRAKRCFCQM